MGQSQSDDSRSSWRGASTSSVDSTIHELASLSERPNLEAPKELGCFDRNFIFGSEERKGSLKEEYEFTGERELGSGSFGWVERCYHTPTGQTRAVKRIAKGKCKKRFSSLRHELEVMRVLDHPNIVRLHKVFEDTRYVHICMEYCNGGELADRINRVGHFAEVDAAAVMKQLMGAVQYMHKQHYIGHRDIKPENCVFASAGNDMDWSSERGQLKLIDFGTADWCRPGQRFTESVGTIAYSAPEAWSGSYDLTCDIWSLGIVLHELLSGRLPVSCDVDCCGVAWQPVSDHAKDLVLGMTRRNPEERWKLEACLQYEWLSKGDPGSKENPVLHPDVVQNMRRYAKGTMLRKAALQAIATNMNQAQITDLGDAFRSLDKNDDGVLSLSEIKEGLAGSPVQLHLESLFKELDTDGDGELQYTEFLAAALNAHSYLQEDVAWGAFKKFDVSGSGAITAQDLRQVFNVASIGNSALIDDIIRKADKNEDCEVCFDEFMQMLEESQTPKSGSSRRQPSSSCVSLSSIKKRPAASNASSMTNGKPTVEMPVLKRPALKRPASSV